MGDEFIMANNFKPFAVGGNANVTSQTDWEQLPALSTGFQSGKASSAQVNKALRQGTTMAAVLAQFIADTTGSDVLDNGALANLVAQFKSALGTATAGKLINVQTFTSSGTYTPSSGTKSVIVEAVGGGGAGGGAPATNASTVSVGGGGTAGTYGMSRYTSGFSGVVITVGSGGVPVSGGTGGNGGASSFGSLLSCPGGSGGGYQGPSSSGFGPLGSASGSNATGANISSAPGSPGGYSFTVSTAVVAGLGGSSRFGGGGTLNTVNGNGATGIGYGAGGGGAANSNSQTAKLGGNGTSGLVVVWEYA